MWKFPGIGLPKADMGCMVAWGCSGRSCVNIWWWGKSGDNSVSQPFSCSRMRCWSPMVPWWDVGSLAMKSASSQQTSPHVPEYWQTTWAWTCTLVPRIHKLVEIRIPLELLWFKPRLSLVLKSTVSLKQKEHHQWLKSLYMFIKYFLLPGEELLILLL